MEKWIVDDLDHVRDFEYNKLKIELIALNAMAMGVLGLMCT